MELQNKHVGDLDTETMAEVFYSFLCEEYGESTTKGVLQYLEIEKEDLHREDLQKQIIRILPDGNGSV
jgi:hypothetical protein